MKRKSEAGQAIILTALALVVLVGFMGFGIDMGVARYEKRVQQTAADAAALAGANNLNYGGVVAAAQDASASDNFKDNGGGNVSACGSGASIGTVCVEIDAPPVDGPHNGQTGYVEARVAAVHPTYFARVLGINQQTIIARAVATNLAGGAGSPSSGCIWTLGAPNKRIQPGVSTSGSVNLQAPDCGITDNGNLVTGGGSSLSITAGSIAVSGSVTQDGTGTVSPDPVSGVPATGTPINVIDTPCSGTGCPSSPSVQINNGGCVGTCPTGVTCSGGTCTIQPGDYSDICISGSTVDFSAGFYVITGSSMCNSGTEFQVNGNSTVCNSDNLDCSGMPQSTNDGVTFYLTGSGSVNIDGTSTAEFTAPNTGTYEGLLFYQDPADTATASLSGTNNTFYQGALDFPSAELIFGGNNTTTGTFNGDAAYTLIVSSWLTLAGNPTIVLNSDYSGLGGNGGPLAGAITSARLVE